MRLSYTTTAMALALLAIAGPVMAQDATVLEQINVEGDSDGDGIVDTLVDGTEGILQKHRARLLPRYLQVDPVHRVVLA